MGNRLFVKPAEGPKGRFRSAKTSLSDRIATPLLFLHARVQSRVIPFRGVTTFRLPAAAPGQSPLADGDSE